MDYNNVLNILFIFFITIIVAYLFGFTIINMIDKRLSKLNLNSMESFKNNDKQKIENIEVATTKTYNFQSGDKISKTNFDEEYYKRKNKDSTVEGYSNNENNAFKEWNIEKKKTQVCIINHKHNKNGSNIKCTYGVTNYADPADMSPIDYRIFNLNYPSNITLQDYINWLYCFIDKEDQLPYNHLKNLEKLKMGIELIEEEGVLPPPSYYYPPLNAKDYFDKMYNESNEFNIAGPLNSITGPMLGYNFDEYSEFSQNLDMNGVSGKLRNDDLVKKKNAKKLYNYVFPKDSNSLNIDNDNEIYHIKNVEI